MSGQGLVPRLRFPEFRNNQGWREVKLAEVLHEHGAKSDGLSEVHSVSVRRGVVNQIEHLGRSFAASNTDHYMLVKPHDVVYTKSPTGDFPFGIVKQSRLPYPVIVSPLYGVFSPETEHLGYLLDAYFESPIRASNYLDPITQKGAKNTIQISNDTFLSKGIQLPEDCNEQRKIAECLMSLDELIAAEGLKLEALRAYKKGLMQNLFPREGETTPRLRFPEFQDTPSWETRLLGDTGRFLPALTGKTASDFDHGDAQYIPYMNVLTNPFTDPVSLRRVSINPSERQSRVRKGDVFLTVSSETPEEAGMSSVLTEEIPNCYLNSFCALYRFNEGQAPLTLFLGYLLRSDVVRTQLTRGAQGVTRYNVSKVSFRSLRLVIPGEREQSRIALCLASLDALITAQTKKLDTLKLHKQGLMQGLFPSVEAG